MKISQSFAVSLVDQAMLTSYLLVAIIGRGDGINRTDGAGEWCHSIWRNATIKQS